MKLLEKILYLNLALKLFLTIKLVIYISLIISIIKKRLRRHKVWIYFFDYKINFTAYAKIKKDI